MAKWFFARTIVQDDSVSAEIDRLTRSLNRFEDAYMALEWLLSRACDEVGALSREVGGQRYFLYRQAGDTVATTPDIVVVYTYDDDEVVLIGLKAEQVETEED